MISREQYMANAVSHDEYYGDIAGHFNFYFLPTFLSRVRDALAAGDEYLNTIPLKEWDDMGGWMLHSSYVRSVLAERGDIVSLAGVVCILKSAAKKAS